jgi:drug/metabolite transporter (DMT)-like permease
LAVGLLTQAAQVNLTKAYHLERAVDISHLTYVGTLWALLLGYLVFGETVPLPALGGIGLVVLGVVLATRAGGAKR